MIFTLFSSAAPKYHFFHQKFILKVLTNSNLSKWTHIIQHDKGKWMTRNYIQSFMVIAQVTKCYISIYCTMLTGISLCGRVMLTDISLFSKSIFQSLSEHNHSTINGEFIKTQDFVRFSNNQYSTECLWCQQKQSVTDRWTKWSQCGALLRWHQTKCLVWKDMTVNFIVWSDKTCWISKIRELKSANIGVKDHTPVSEKIIYPCYL